MFLISCSVAHLDTKSIEKKQQELTPLDQANLYLEKQEHSKAIESLKDLVNRDPSNAQAYYLLAKAYTLSKDYPNAISCYQKSLQIHPVFHESYISLRNIYRLNLLNIRKKTEDAVEKRVQAKKEGSPEIQTLQKNWVELLYEKAKLHISESTTYLLYQDRDSNISEFPELEAHLRDIQDSLKEIEEGKSKQPIKSKDIKDPLYHEIQNKRSDVAKKHARVLIEYAQEWQSKKNLQKAIDSLKDADAQIAKFYKEEDPTSETFLLNFDNEVLTLSQTIYSKLLENYEASLIISASNRSYLKEIEEWQQAEDESKYMEQILESMAQTQINSLWRYEKIKKEDAEDHPSMIVFYEKFLQHTPESSKIGEYHYRLAQAYHKKGDTGKALDHARTAEQMLQTYQARDFLKLLEGKQ